jgi:hypothetical protein
MTATGPAPRAQLEELHRLLTETLLEAMGPRAKRKPGIELLAVVGAYLRQEGVRAAHVNQRRVRQVRELYRLHTLALMRALEQDRPSAGVLAEVGSFLRANNITKDYRGPDAVAPLRVLSGGDVPFK